jgi:uncharacterized protein (TIGR02246 family)
MRPPVPPFTEETARQKVQAAEDAWNTRDPEKVAAAYTEDSQWRNRDEFVTGRPAIVEFLRRKWDRELDYALRKDLWAFTDNRIAVRFQYEAGIRRGSRGAATATSSGSSTTRDTCGVARQASTMWPSRRASGASSARARSRSTAHRCRWPDL